ncbi:MAG: insulinase family protein [Bacteroides sp.]|nr:insulinase family protein [Bacteroides sp.]
MKQKFKFMIAAALIVGGSYHQTFAQQQQMPIPIDPNVRIGKLENGLTYYIRKNSLPEKRADFYIAQKVGSIQETPEQSGLAHFLEHMCFNGTTHFPGNELSKYLETIGVKFGENLNAYTSIDETVYNISNVPVVREGIIDSCLLILHDWANDLLLEPTEIDKERGVIHEEWRSRMSAMQRMQEKALPQMFAGTKYAYCMPIGNMDVVLNFKYQTLRDYYETWYRPDLQGIMVVGDIDVDQMENKIKALFSPIPAQPNAPERIYYPVNDNTDPIIVIEQDKEQPHIQLLFFNKHEAIPDEQKNHMDYMVFHYAKAAIIKMLNARLEELRLSHNPPYIYAGAYDDDFFVAKTKDAFTGYTVCREDNIEGGFETLLREIERARRFGFTESEYVRARADILRDLESEYNERDKKKNDSYIDHYVRHFLDNEPIPSIDDEYAILNQIAPAIPVEALNQMMPSLVTGSNQVVAIFGPEKEGLVYPTKEAIAAILNKVKAEDLTAYEDKVSNEPLIAQLPTPGKIVSEKKDGIFGTTILTLSNGAKVMVKHTDFKADEIQMKGISWGGTSLYPDSELANLQHINGIISVGGIGNFSPVELEKVLAGKKAWASASVYRDTEEITGSSSPKDFETMLQLAYLSFTSPRKDQEAFNSYISRTKAALQNQELNPMVAFSDSISSSVFMNHPRSRRLKSSDLDKINYDRVFEIFQERYKDASDFTFLLVGNINLEEAKPLIEQYLGALPSINRKESFADNNILSRPGIYKNEFIKEQETAKASNFVYYHGKVAYNFRNEVLMSMLAQIMDLVYTEKVREDEGGTYGVSVNGSIYKYPREEFAVQIIFETSPSKREQLMKIIFAEIDNVAQTGPSEVNLNKVKEYMLKKHSEDLKENGYWMAAIRQYVFEEVDSLDGYTNLINSITTNDIRNFANDLFVKQKNEIEVSMISPEKE